MAVKGFDFSSERDFKWLGDSDEGLRRLARFMGLEEEAQALHNKIKQSIDDSKRRGK